MTENRPPEKEWCSYRDQSWLRRPEREQDQRRHVADSSGNALCDGAPLLEEHAQELTYPAEVLQCRKPRCRKAFAAHAAPVVGEPADVQQDGAATPRCYGTTEGPPLTWKRCGLTEGHAGDCDPNAKWSA